MFLSAFLTIFAELANADRRRQKGVLRGKIAGLDRTFEKTFEFETGTAHVGIERVTK